MEGKGEYTWSNGRKYVGEFKNDKENGKGRKTYPSGDVYVGDYVDGNFTGQGKEIDKLGNIKREGQWLNGKF